MKKSWGHFALFVFVLALSIFVPVYILSTGSATLMPLAQAGAVLSMVVGVTLGSGTAFHVYQSERRMELGSHAALVRAKVAINSRPVWRNLFSYVRHFAQVLLLLALGQPLFAAFVLCGIVGWLVHIGMLAAYFDRLPVGRRQV